METPGAEPEPDLGDTIDDGPRAPTEEQLLAYGREHNLAPRDASPPTMLILVGVVVLVLAALVFLLI